jgi:hypothetical protein
MKRILTTAALASLIVGPAFAAGDPPMTRSQIISPAPSTVIVQPGTTGETARDVINSGGSGTLPGLLPSQIGTDTPRGDEGPAVAPSAEEPPVPPYNQPGGD